MSDCDETEDRNTTSETISHKHKARYRIDLSRPEMNQVPQFLINVIMWEHPVSLAFKHWPSS